MPPDYLLPLLFNIEKTVLEVATDYPKLVDKEVEQIYTQVRAYLLETSRGKDIDEPYSSIKRKDELIEAIFKMLDSREQENLDEEYINNPDYAPGGIPFRNLDHFYTTALRYLIKSAKRWRKEFGPKGYLTFIRSQIGDLGME